MSRTLTRPMFRKGGMAQREKYMGGGITTPRIKRMGGGMTGIMSGIRPDAGLTPRVGYQEGTPPGLLKRAATGGLNLLKRGFSKAYNLIPEEGIGTILARNFPRTAAVGKGTSVMTAPFLPTAGIAAANYPVYPKGHPQEGEFMPIDEARKVLEETGAASSMATGKSVQAGSAADIEGEAAMFDLETGEYPNKRYATKIDYESPEVIETAKEIGVLPKDDDKDKPDSLDITGGEKDIKDEESALMKAYKEYAPIFEKELGVSDEDTKKSLYMNLAKFGAGILAQPGGDLVGAIGKAAEKPLEGASATLKEKTDAKRQAKLLALQTAISEGKPGTIGKAIKDIAKVYKVSEKEAAKIYEKWNENTSTAQAADTRAYREFAEKKNVNPEGFTRNIKKLLASDDADLVGKFNKRLPMDDGVPDVDEIVDKEYYIGEGGELYRADKSTDPPTLLEPGDPGFKDSKKEE